MNVLRQRGLTVLLALGLLIVWGCQSSPEGNTPAGAEETSAETAAESPATTAVSIPDGTEIQVRLADTLGSATSQSGDTFEATLDAPIVVGDWVAVPKGARVLGRVTTAQPSGRLKTPSKLLLTLTALEIDGQRYDINTSNYVRSGPSHKKRNVGMIAGGAAGGALIGGLIGGKKGAAIGAGAGAGGGTATAYATGKKDIVLPSETRLSFTLRQPVTINRST